MLTPQPVSVAAFARAAGPPADWLGPQRMPVACYGGAFLAMAKGGIPPQATGGPLAPLLVAWGLTIDID
eukprot:10217318-Lingulodinium_polyedra.AAC.1